MNRDRNCREDVTIETCSALRFELEGVGELYVWREGRKPFRPVEDKRLTELQAGDLVQFQGGIVAVKTVEIYR